MALADHIPAGSKLFLHYRESGKPIRLHVTLKYAGSEGLVVTTSEGAEWFVPMAQIELVRIAS